MNPRALWRTLWFKVVVGLLILCVGILIGWGISVIQPQELSIVPVRDPAAGYKLINPILYTNVPESFSYPTYSPLQNALNSYVVSAENSNKAAAISVYFQDLNSAEWVGVDPSEKFDPASMLKVAVLIALFRASEINPAILAGNVAIPANANISNGSEQTYFPSTEPIKAGNTYSVQDLMGRLIIQSDDGADEVLIALLGNNNISEIFTDLRIPIPGSSTGVSPQEYSHLFRVLYNSTYLTSSDSEKALDLLSETNYTAGLVAGVPSSVTVAHKFGESMSPPVSAHITWPPPPTSSSSDVPGLSDCGIVYYPNHPYFLCVMTQGTDFNTLASIIKDISNITYTQVNALYTK